MTQAPSRTTVVNGVDLDAVAAAVRACPGVDDLNGGPLNARLATYLPGRKIDGLKLTDDTLTVQIRIVWDVPVTEVGEQIRAATLLLAPGRRVDLVIADITPAPGYEVIPEPDPEPAVSEALTPPAPIAPAPAGTPAEDALVSAPPPAPAEPVVVERTVSLTEKVVLDRTSVDASAAKTSPSQAPPPAPGMSSVPADPVTRSESDSVAGDQAESDSVVWTTETTTTPPSAADGDESSSAPTTPTPAEIPPRS